MLCKKLFLSGILVFVLLSFCFIVSVKASSEMWSQTYGGEGSEKAYSLVESSDGGYALAGYTYPSDAEESDVWLVKTDSNGNMVWNQTYGEGSIRALVQTSDGGYALAGRANKGDWDIYRDFLLVKTDNHGNMEWNRTYGGKDLDHAYSLVQTSDGGFALVGDTSPNLLGSPRDIWLVKTDAYGVMEWNRTYGGASYGYAYSLIVTSDGGFALAGCTTSFGAGHEDFWLVKTDEDGDIMWNQTYGGEKYDCAYALVETSDGGYTIAGYTNSSGGGEEDVWLVKTDSNGNMVWNQTYGEGSIRALVQTSDGGYALAGGARLVKTDTYGNMMWNQTYEGEAYALVQTSDGGYALAGQKNGDFWLAKTDEHGIIPEFPSWTLLIVTLTAVLVVAVIYRHYLNKCNQGRRKSEKICISACSVDINSFA
jgi:hypothetical protein